MRDFLSETVIDPILNTLGIPLMFTRIHSTSKRIPLNAAQCLLAVHVRRPNEVHLLLLVSSPEEVVTSTRFNPLKPGSRATTPIANVSKTGVTFKDSDSVKQEMVLDT